MENSQKILEGLEKAYKRMIEFKKYKKTPVITIKGGKIVELDPNKIIIRNNVYSRKFS